ncbi:MAG: DUF3793 family protein [Verrucomicrobiota bacterium]|jgi:hypothetical protein|nr:DUF3793 family protein [Verrucomicrobiota bacterium]
MKKTLNSGRATALRCDGDRDRLLRRLLIEAAPILSKLKPAMLTRISGCSCMENVRHDHLFCRHQGELVGALGLEHRILVQSSSGVLVFFYDPVLLSETLADPQNRRFLAARGCCGAPSLTADLNWLENRFHSFSHTFPHEIGVFLGYPLKDVEGFVGCQRSADVGQGTDWRVFGDPSASLALMGRFRAARERLRKRLQREADAERFCLRLLRQRGLAS